MNSNIDEGDDDDDESLLKLSKIKLVNHYNENDEENPGYTYVNPIYTDEFLTSLYSLFKEKKFCDTVLICGEKPKISDHPLPEQSLDCCISCHKIVLSSFSDYFRAMFSSDCVETQTGRVYLPEFDAASLAQVIHYAYSGQLTLNVDNVQNVFAIASFLNLPQLVTACADYMESQLDLSNALDTYAFARAHFCEYLEFKSRDYVNRYITELIKTDEFVQFENAAFLCDLLSSNDLELAAEQLLLLAILSWCQFDSSTRHVHFERLFRTCVRLQFIERPILADMALKFARVIESSPWCKQIIEDYIDGKISNDSNGGVNFSQAKRSGMLRSEKCFLLIGGNCELDDGSYVNCFNPFNGDKYFLSKNFVDKSLTKGYFHIENPGVCVTSENRVFVAGGVYVYHEYMQYNNTAAQKTKKSSQRPTQSKDNKRRNENKPDEFATLFDGRDSLKDGEEILSKKTFEYDSLNDMWIKRTNMLFAKSNFSLCAMNNQNKLYSFGGVNSSQEPLDIVEMFDVAENKWTYVGSIPTPFVAGCVVIHQDVFYVLGGRNGLDLGRHDSCYMFKPASKEWTSIGRLNVGRFNFGACVLNDRIYVFGGQRYDESEENYFTREALDSVEVFDLVDKREWSAGVRMPASLYNTGVCVFDEQTRSLYVCGTTECKYSRTKLLGFMLDFGENLELDDPTKSKWTVVEHDVSEIKTYYRCVAARISARKLHKFQADMNRLQADA